MLIPSNVSRRSGSMPVRREDPRRLPFVRRAVEVRLPDPDRLDVRIGMCTHCAEWVVSSLDSGGRWVTRARATVPVVSSIVVIPAIVG